METFEDLRNIRFLVEISGVLTLFNIYSNIKKIFLFINYFKFSLNLALEFVNFSYKGAKDYNIIYIYRDNQVYFNKYIRIVFINPEIKIVKVLKEYFVPYAWGLFETV